MATGWVEAGDRVFVRRYAFFDQNIVAVIGRDETLVVDTRTTLRHADEVIDHLRELSAPPVAVVVNTHGHSDHCFGNARFRPAVAWGHERCVAMLRETGERQRAALIANMPDLAGDLRAVRIDPPERTFAEQVTVEAGGRLVELRYLGRGHTDNDIVVAVPDADVVCAGDLLENDATPWFGDGFPMDWPATAEALLGLVGERTVVVPGHGAHAGRAFVETSLDAFRALADLARRVHGGALSLEDATEAGPYAHGASREPLRRALAQLRGELEP
jgi:glyoxylase-like metal-dependent hydrolase (beta-lactamase superfamily II)